MKLILMRHGEAAYDGQADPLRPLTERGRQQVADSSTFIKAHLSDSFSLYASPYLRAQQSAQILSETVNCSLHTCDLIIPDGDGLNILKRLSQLDAETVILVSHNPLMGMLLTFVCDLEPGLHRMSTASVAVVDMQAGVVGGGELVEIYHSRH